MSNIARDYVCVCRCGMFGLIDNEKYRDTLNNVLHSMEGCMYDSKDQTCECGAHILKIEPFQVGHATYCPVRRSAL